jgi:hypothetical protein
MKSIFFVLMLSSIAFHSHSQSELRYQWKPNTSFKFKAVQTDQINMGGSGMMGMMAMTATNMQFKTESMFTLKINKVMADGSASGTFFLNNFKVTDNQGNTLANISNLPANGIRSEFIVTAKGNFTFFTLPILLSREGGTSMLVSTKIEKGEFAATAEADGEKVTLFAEFNPKTGALKAGYSAQTISKPKPKPVTVKEEDETIDLIPSEFLDLLELPEGPLSAGSSFRTRMYDTEITQKVLSLNQNIAKINFDVKSAISAQKFEQDAKEMAGENETEEMSDDNVSLPGMGEGTPNIAQEVSGNFTLDFDNNKGMMNAVNGNINSNMNMMGMEIKSKSNLKLTLIP